MATETITRLVDDLDGGTAERTVSFAWDGKSYEIDLSKKNIAAFERAIRPYLTAARTPRSTSGGGPRQGRRAVSTRRTDLPAIRDWARANGHEVSDRGRIAAGVVEAYEATR
ncbi:MAG: putative Lsr2-like protein [Frankiales bacterium]|nr:putative Lsr2-like protein [Frankiales bacterium]